MEKHIIWVQFTLEMFNQTTTVNTLIVYQFTLHSCECVRINNFVYNVYVCVIAVLLCLIESIAEQNEGCIHM